MIYNWTKYRLCAMQSDSGRAENLISVATGFKQGDVNAPLLYNVYIDTIVRAFQPLISKRCAVVIQN